MRPELQLNVSRPAGAPLVTRVCPVVIELLLIGGQREENGFQEENRVAMQCMSYICHV